MGDTRTSRQLVFDLGPQCGILHSPGEVIICDLESNYELPFRADPSMQLVGIKVGGNYVNGAWSPPRVLLVRSQILSAFTSRIGTTPTIRWEEWSHFTKPIRIRGLSSPEFHLLHSHLVCPPRSLTEGFLLLRVFDISLECRRGEGDPSAAGEYSDQVLVINSDALRSTLYLSASNIVFKPSSVHDLVSSTLFGTVFASSGLNATPPSMLV